MSGFDNFILPCHPVARLIQDPVRISKARRASEHVFWNGSAGARVLLVRQPTASVAPLSSALCRSEISYRRGVLGLSQRPLVEDSDTSGSTQDEARAASVGSRAQVLV